MAEHIDFYRCRKARRGFGARKLELLERYWQLDHEITYYIIADAAGSNDHLLKRNRAEAEREIVGTELHRITRPVE